VTRKNVAPSVQWARKFRPAPHYKSEWAWVPSGHRRLLLTQAGHSICASRSSSKERGSISGTTNKQTYFDPMGLLSIFSTAKEEGQDRADSRRAVFQ